MSGKRTTAYAFGAAVVALGAYYVKAKPEEIVLWNGLLLAGIPFGALVMATIRTWPRKPKASTEDA